MDFTLHPGVYSTSRHTTGLRSILEKIWIHDHGPGEGTIYIISGFANFNGGARFYQTFKKHVEEGGRIVAYLAGSTSARMSSEQVVKELIACGAEVKVINRRRMLHAKCYGRKLDDGQSLVVTSGNFTGPGMAQNVEAAVLLQNEEVSAAGFDWESVIEGIGEQSWQRHDFREIPEGDRRWELLYDETPGRIEIDESDEMTLLLILGHYDTARIQADEGTPAGKGTQYFLLSKDCFDFFPALTILNERGEKRTQSALITMHYMDMKLIEEECRVTYEVENNQDFRLGTGPLRYTKMAEKGDLACITRVADAEYQLRIISDGTPAFAALEKFAIHNIGHKEKRFGYVDNEEFQKELEESGDFPDEYLRIGRHRHGAGAESP